MKILITGGSGFIGKNLTEQMGKRYEVAAPSSSELNLLDDTGVKTYLNANQFDVVIHTATWNATRNSIKDTSKVLEYNLRMFFNLSRCDDAYGKMIYFGSGAEFDRKHWMPKMSEDYFDTHVPQDDYGLSKYIMTKYALTSRNIYNLRLFGVFGKYEDWEIRFISNACCKAVFDLPITIKQNVLFDYLYIDDMVRITDHFVRTTPKEHVFNVCTGKAYDLISLARKVLAASGKGLEIKTAVNGMGREYSGNNKKLLSENGDVSFSDIDRTIQTLYAWYETRKDCIDRKMLMVDK